MSDIKINIKVVILSILIAILMYPKTIVFLINTGKNIYVAKTLSTSTVQNDETSVNIDKNKVVFMFDDGWGSVYSEGYDIMKKYNFKGTIGVIPSRVSEKEYMSYKQLSELYLDRWDLLNHSYSHNENLYSDSDKLLSDFNRAKQWMENRYIGKSSNVIVMPYGEINPYLIGQFKEAGYRNIRTSDNIITLDKTKIEYYPITTISLLTDVSVEKVKNLLSQMLGQQKTIIFILHKIGDEDDSFGMTYSKDKLEQIIQFIHKNSKEFEVITYSQLF